MKKLKKIILGIIGFCYSPVFLLSFMLHFIARALLALSYLGLLEFSLSLSVFQSLFKIVHYGNTGLNK